MKSTVKKNFPLVVTDRVQESKKFYQELFSFEVVFEEEWYVHLVNDSGIELGFLKPNLENQPDFLHGTFTGGGIVFSLEVEDVIAEYERIKKLGLEILLDYKEEPWGQKHFIIKDPSGVFVDVLELTNPNDF